MPNSASTFALRLPTSLKKAVEALCKKEGVSLNTFIVVAAAEKVATLRTVDFIEARAAKGDESPKVRKAAKRTKSR